MAVVCGQSHTAAVTENCQLFTWGPGDEGLLGLSALEHSMLPTLVKGLEMSGASLFLLAAGDEHSADVASVGLVWTWLFTAPWAMVTRSIRGKYCEQAGADTGGSKVWKGIIYHARPDLALQLDMSWA